MVTETVIMQWKKTINKHQKKHERSLHIYNSKRIQQVLQQTTHIY